MNTSIYFAPLQSFTTLPYYLAFNNQIGGIDKYFTPFYRTDKDGNFSLEKYLYQRKQINLVPQVLTNNPKELVLFAVKMIERGFKEINLNLGCPFPLVVNRKLGSGLLPYPEDLEKILLAFFKENIPLRLSVKLRLGLRESTEIIPIIKVLKNFPLEEVILHPRLGIQKYKGTPDWEGFAELNNQFSMVGNGDITTEKNLQALQYRFTNVKAWMIGRGLLVNPCMLQSELDWKETMHKLHDEFLDNLQDFDFSEHQVLSQLKCFWDYPSQNIEGGQRIYRKMKKVGNVELYTELKERLLALA